MTRAKLKSMKKEELIETIETLENNYGATIERANNSYNYGKSEIERLEKEIAELKAENKQIIKRERVVPEHYLCEMIEKNKELKAQNETILEDNDTLNKWVDELKAQIEKMKCENKYVVSDDNSNGVPCYTVYDCKHCSKRS